MQGNCETRFPDSAPSTLRQSAAGQCLIEATIAPDSTLLDASTTNNLLLANLALSVRSDPGSQQGSSNNAVPTVLRGSQGRLYMFNMTLAGESSEAAPMRGLYMPVDGHVLASGANCLL